MDNSKSEKPSTVDLEVVNRETAFDRKRRIAGAIFGPICALLVWMTPISDLTPEAHTLLAIMTLVALWWIRLAASESYIRCRMNQISMAMWTA